MTSSTSTAPNDINNNQNIIQINANDNILIQSKTKICVQNFLNYFLDFHTVSKKKNKKAFMMTPCNHIYHSECLEGWINQNRVCPSCRREIPSIDS